MDLPPQRRAMEHGLRGRGVGVPSFAFLFAPRPVEPSPVTHVSRVWTWEKGASDTVWKQKKRLKGIRLKPWLCPFEYLRTVVRNSL